jgi:hypothetical protein
LALRRSRLFVKRKKKTGSPEPARKEAGTLTIQHQTLAGNDCGAAQQPSLFPLPVFRADPCASKHGGAETSTSAHNRVRPHKRVIYERVLAIIRARGSAGATVHELAEVLDTFPSNISGRLTEMRALRLLTYKLDSDGAKVKRRGACVLLMRTEAQEG